MIRAGTGLTAAPSPAARSVGADGGAAAAVTALAWRLIRRGAAVTTVVVATMSAFVVLQYRWSAERFDLDSLAELAANPAVRALFGVPRALDDAGGFTVWRTGTPLAVLVSVWGLLAATRITRGEEEARHWALLLAGPVPMPRVVLQHLLVLGSATSLLGAAAAAAMIVAGTKPAGALLYGAGLALVGATFAAVGTLAAQLVPERRQAAGIAGSVVGLALMLRMLGDAVAALDWLSWLNPYGLLANTRPFAGDRWLPLVVLAAMAGAAATAAVVLAGRRDTEAGLWSPSPVRKPRLMWMRSPARFAIHRGRRGLVLWAAGMAAYFGLVGSLADSMTRFLAENPRFTELATAAGVRGLSELDGYTAAILGLLALPIGAVAAGLVAEDAEDEAERRLTTLLALPVSRVRWALTLAAVSALACVALALVAGAAFWAGGAFAGAGMSPAAVLGAALNGMPVVLVCLGAALFALGWAPRAVFVVGSLPTFGGFLLMVLAETFGWPGWVRALSPFAHVADVPVSDVDLGGTAVLLISAVVLGAAGIHRYTRRDLRG